MLATYPLKPVITVNPLLVSRYNGHPSSHNLVSKCITPQEAEQLLDAGAVFESVVLVDGAGEDLIGRINPSGSADVNFAPRIDRLRLDEASEDPVVRIHVKLQDQSISSVFFNFGG
jgi:hypothetical protein